MTSANDYQPRAEDKFSFGLWTVGNRGRDAFGDAVRPHISPAEIVSMLAEVGRAGASTCMTTISCRSTQPPPNADSIVTRSRQACEGQQDCCSHGDRLTFFPPRIS